MAETDNDIDIKVGVDGVTQTVAELEKVNTAVSKSAKSTEQMAVAQKKVQEATTKSNVSIGQFGSSLGLAGQALGRVNPQMGQLVSVAGSATGAIQGLTTMGLGPMGIALGVVSIALNAGVSAWDAYKDSQRRLEERIRNTTIPTIEALITKMNEASEKARILARLNQGGGTLQEYQANEQRGSEYLSLANDRLQMARQSGSPADVVRAQRERDRAERASDAQRQQLFAAESRDREERASNPLGMVLESSEEAPRVAASRGGGSRAVASSGGRGKAAQNAAFENAQAQLAAQQSIQDQVFAKQQEFNIAQEQQREAFDQLMRDKDVERVERAREAEEQITEAMLAENEKRLNAAQAEADARIASAQKTAEMISTIGSITSGVYGFIDDAVKKTDESEEERFKREKARIGVEAAINAVVYGASAAAAFATGNIPGGIGFTAAATMSAAAAVKAGIDAGAGPAATGGGGMQRPDSPQNLGGGNGGGNVTVLMTGPVLAGTDRAAFGRELNAVISDANNRYGNAA